MAKKDILTAIDIGANSIKVLIGEINNGKINILDKREVSQFGIRGGEIYNPKNVARTIFSLKNSIENEKEIKLKKAVVSIGGVHLSAVRSRGMISVSRADQKISEEDIQRVIQASKATASISANKEVLDVLPIEFIINGEEKVENPLNLAGVRLEVEALIVQIFSPVIDNVVEIFSETGLEIEKIVPTPVASAEAVLTSQQKELGSAVLDIGAATSSLAVFNKGKMINFSIFPLGSANITNDLALGLRTTIALAEKIKKEYGFVSSEKRRTGKSLSKNSKKAKGKEKRIEIPEEDISISRAYLEKIIKNRIFDLFEESSKLLKKMAKDISLPGGIVLTGGGANLSGLVNFAKNEFELPVYLSKGNKIEEAEGPEFSTAAGLLLTSFYSGEEMTSGAGKENPLKKIIKLFLP